MIKHTTYLSLGTNLGDKDANILKAIEKIQEMVGDVVRQSSLFKTEPWGFESENMFVNAAICVETTLTPYELLRVTQRIEREMGRVKKTRVERRETRDERREKGEERRETRVVYHDRIIDIDILTYDDVEIDEADLKIPHPLMHQRDFVMMPLKEIKKD